MSWTFTLPPEIEFGVGRAEQLAEILSREQLENGILICDPIFTQNGLAEKIMKAAQGRIIATFSNLVSNPTTENVNTCTQMVKQLGCSFAVSLGGGSSLDCAKAVCSLCKTADDISAYLYGHKKFTEGNCIPLIAMPTTAGTGSEVTAVAVVSDPATCKKLPIASKNFYPKLAILDPALTVSVPPSVTASCGLDVLSQALEGYWSRSHQPICDAAAIAAGRLVFTYLERAFHNGSDLEARTKICEASLLAGIAFALPKTSGPHVCSYPLTSVYHVPHGEACAMTLDRFLRLNAAGDGGRLHEYARSCGFSDANAMADRILAMKQAMGMKTRLSEAGVCADQLEELVAQCNHPNMALNPVEITNEILMDLFLNMM